MTILATATASSAITVAVIAALVGAFTAMTLCLAALFVLCVAVAG